MGDDVASDSFVGGSHEGTQQCASGGSHEVVVLEHGRESYVGAAGEGGGAGAGIDTAGAAVPAVGTVNQAAQRTMRENRGINRNSLLHFVAAQTDASRGKPSVAAVAVSKRKLRGYSAAAAVQRLHHFCSKTTASFMPLRMPLT